MAVDLQNVYVMITCYFSFCVTLEISLCTDCAYFDIASFSAVNEGGKRLSYS